MSTDRETTDAETTDQSGSAAGGDAGPGSEASSGEPEPGGGPAGPGDEDPGGEGGPGGVSWGRALVLAAALAFLGFAVGLVVARDRPPGEGSVDVGFSRDMITHHQQALGVATLAIAQGEDPTVRSYAREVLTFQAQEIGVMRQTLRDWGYGPDDRPVEAMAWMGMAVPYEQMAGLLSEDQLDALRAARGREADALFLELMAEHHRGGLHMAEHAAREASDAGVRELAATMVRNQAREIDQYRDLARDEGYDVDISPAEVPAEPPG